MVLIRLFDGTADVKYARALIPAFAEHAKYRQMLCTPTPGEIDLRGYRIVRDAERRAYDSCRGQVDVMKLVSGILNGPGVQLAGQNTFTLSDQDFFHHDLNWGFGCVIPDDRGGMHVALSTCRLQDLSLLAHVATHELGHMFDAPRPGRRNTEDLLGTHCTNTCVMQQRLSVDEMVRHATALSRRRDKFCTDCQEDLLSAG